MGSLEPLFMYVFFVILFGWLFLVPFSNLNTDWMYSSFNETGDPVDKKNLVYQNKLREIAQKL